MTHARGNGQGTLSERKKDREKGVECILIEISSGEEITYDQQAIENEIMKASGKTLLWADDTVPQFRQYQELLREQK